MSISDSRKVSKGRQLGNRHRFLERHKAEIKRRVDQKVYNTNIKRAADGTKMKVRNDTEPTFNYASGGLSDRVLPGNKQFNPGDQVRRPESGQGQGRGSGKGEGGEDDFEFLLTKEELIEIYFKDMELPNMIKESLNKEVKYSLRTGGYTKEGIPPRLAIKKTFESAIARRIANKKEGHKSPFLDETDLRYRNKYKVPEPFAHAVMFCVMDVSGSMQREHKEMAKRFYMLLYLFLSKFYKDIDLVFVRYHSVAYECDEYQFFHGRDTGGTVVHSAMDVVRKVITERYPVSDYNLYLAHASDGGIGYGEDDAVEKDIADLAEIMQYVSYVQLDPFERQSYDNLIERYEAVHRDNIGIAAASSDAEIYPALQKLFRKHGIGN